MSSKAYTSKRDLKVGAGLKNKRLSEKILINFKFFLNVETLLTINISHNKISASTALSVTNESNRKSYPLYKV